MQYKLLDENGTDITGWQTARDGVAINSGVTATTTLTAQSDGYQIYWQVRAATSNPSSGSYTSAGTGLTVDCVTAVSLTVSQSLGDCSAASGYQTSTLSIQNSSGSTAYVTVEYSIDGGSYVVHNDGQEVDNLTITDGSTNTSLTVNVSHGSTITWRYKSSDTSGDWTDLSYSTLSVSDAADCVVDSLTVSQSLSTCYGGSTTSTL